MVNARLHIICGNCGSNDEFSYEVEYDSENSDGMFEVYIRCANCSTIHDLQDTMKEHDK